MFITHYLRMWIHLRRNSRCKCRRNCRMCCDTLHFHCNRRCHDDIRQRLQPEHHEWTKTKKPMARLSKQLVRFTYQQPVTKSVILLADPDGQLMLTFNVLQILYATSVPVCTNYFLVADKITTKRIITMGISRTGGKEPRRYWKCRQTVLHLMCPDRGNETVRDAPTNSL